jgi:adenine-specific DNA-methyltransferase
MVSYNDEAWLRPEQITASLRTAGHEQVRVLAFDSKRYVGAQIGIHDPRGRKVGTVSHLRNTEYLVVAGSAGAVEAALSSSCGATPACAREPLAPARR